jgi:hypothetical protein
VIGYKTQTERNNKKKQYQDQTHSKELSYKNSTEKKT